MSKNNVVLNIEETIQRIEQQLATTPTESAWMIPLEADLRLLLQDAQHTSEFELDQKLRSVLDKHQPQIEDADPQE